MVISFFLVFFIFQLLVVHLIFKPAVKFIWSLTALMVYALLLASGVVGNLVFISPYIALIFVGFVLLFTTGFVRWLLLLFFGWISFGYDFISKMHSSSIYQNSENQPYFTGLVYDGQTGVDLKFLLLITFLAVVVCVLQSERPRQTCEQLTLVMIAIVAGLFTFNTDNLIILYLNLELQALALYTLVGYYKVEDESTDAALRYLLAGSVVSGFTLFGFVTLYTGSGSFHLSEYRGFTSLGGIWILGALFFKLGVFPFHFWTPSIYTPLDWPTLLLVVGPAKINIWFLIIKVFSPVLESMWWVVFFAGVLSVIVGSIGGLFQTNAASLLAYSGILNGGYIMLLILVHKESFVVNYYLSVYFLGTSAIIVLLSLFADPQINSYSYWNKLGILTPLLIYYLALNLGGLPIYPGFFAKLWLIKGLTSLGLFYVFFIVLMSIIPAVYYVSLAAQAIFGYSDKESRDQQPGNWNGVSVLGFIVVTLGFIDFIIMLFSV